MINLDTHILIYALSGDVTKKEKSLLSRNVWSVAAIVMWELAKLRQLRRIDVELEDPAVARTLASIHVWPLDMQTALQSTRLDFKSDPADELIAATSIVHKVPLLTRDARIKASRMVPFC